MYTQCPDCEIAFKVTADVLKQAAGKVRCGGCGNAFNALAYLSEKMPRQPAAKEASAELPELRPEIIETDDGLPQAISAEQSAALLKTLDELAGSDIRIEDTGVEWRVLDEQEAAAPAAGDDDAGPGEVPGIDADNVDEFLDDAQTPIDEFLTATPEVVESAEIFDEAANGLARTRVDELRFDDNTPLPDDFDLDEESSYTPATEPDPGTEDDEADAPTEEPLPEIALSEPDEWTDILGEFEDLAGEVAAPIDVPEEPVAEIAEESNDCDRDTDEPIADEPLDMDTQFALQAEAMGIDLSGINELEEEDNVDELEDLDIEDDVEDEGLEDELEAVEVEDLDIEDDVEDEELDVEDEDEELEDELEAVEVEDLDIEDDVEDEELDDEIEDDIEDSIEDEELDIEDDVEDEGLEDELEAVEVEDLDGEDDVENELDEEAGEPEELIEEPIVESHTIEDELAAADEKVEEAEEAEEEDSSEHYVPPMTEDEQTVNMQIDQDLMALAIEDEDGFASTIVIPEKDTEKKGYEEKAGLKEEEEEEEEDEDLGEEIEESPGFETIIMEGEFVRSAMDSEKLAADAAAAAELGKIARAKDAEQVKQSGSMRSGVIAGIILLVLLLAVQAIHQSREALATSPAFGNTVGQLYRVIGQPVQPAWDITGWRFEATKGNIEGEEEELTIYSRLGNNSERALPYPLIGISLTDRFEETIGSRILDPSEYLPSDLDPRKLVEPGSTFNAVITIKSASEEATGFKLNVCYRLSDGQLRCAIDDFK